MLALTAGLTLGTLAAVHQGGWTDRLVALFVAAGIALPQFWVGLVLVIVFSLQLDWLPATGYSPLSRGPGSRT